VIVYLLLNQVNLKGYVGQHKGSDLAKRWTAGLRNVKPNPHIAAAIKKYGSQAFSREVLAHCRTQEETDNVERLWICVLRTYDPKHGYNMQYGGLRKEARHVPEIRKKIVRRWTLEGRQRLAETIRLQWQNRTPAERAEIGLKIRQRKEGRPSPNKGRNFGKQKNPCLQRRSISEEAKRRISDGLKRYYANLVGPHKYKQVYGAQGQVQEVMATNRKPSRGVDKLNGGRYAAI
jgi:group I intron endonuclease